MPENPGSGGAFEPRIVGFFCNWCTYTGADMAGVARMTYAPNVRVVRVMCSGRLDPQFILTALRQGADAVLIGGCHPGDCHYSEGNYHTRRRMTVLKSLLDFLGIDGRRLQLSWVSASEGKKWAEVVDAAVAEVRKAGPNPAKGNNAIGDQL